MIVYYIDGKKFTTKDYYKIPHDKICSLNEETPAWEDLITGEKLWCIKDGILHRLNGPAFIDNDGKEMFCLNGKRYNHIRDWLKEHPNQDNAFQVEMLLKYT
jgi:hypothetical protein